MHTCPYLSTCDTSSGLLLSETLSWMCACSAHLLKYATDWTCVDLGKLAMYPRMHFTSASDSSGNGGKYVLWARTECKCGAGQEKTEKLLRKV